MVAREETVVTPVLDRPERRRFFDDLADMAGARGQDEVAEALRSEPVVLAVLQAEELWRAGGGAPLEETRALPSREEADTARVQTLEGVLCPACGWRGTP